MNIAPETVLKKLSKCNLRPKGALHIGAHECEEMGFYNNMGIKNEDIVWIDAMVNKVNQARSRGIPNVYHAVVTDQDDQEVTFNVSNNVQSSSVLEFGTHSKEVPYIVFVDRIKQKTLTIDTFFERNNLDASKYDFWNFDIQGAELMALKGAKNAIKYPKAIYLEVNVDELYIGCPLLKDIDEYLAEHDFTRVITNITKHGWGDALYIKNSYCQKAHLKSLAFDEILTANISNQDNNIDTAEFIIPMQTKLALNFEQSISKNGLYSVINPGLYSVSYSLLSRLIDMDLKIQVYFSKGSGEMVSGTLSEVYIYKEQKKTVCVSNTVILKLKAMETVSLRLKATSCSGNFSSVRIGINPEGTQLSIQQIS